MIIKVSPNDIMDYKSGDIFQLVTIYNLDGFEQHVPESELFANITGNVNITGQTSATMTQGNYYLYLNLNTYKIQKELDILKQ